MAHTRQHSGRESGPGPHKREIRRSTELQNSTQQLRENETDRLKMAAKPLSSRS